MAPTAPAVGDSVAIEEVQSGSHDVVGMTGTLTSAVHDASVVRVEFSSRVSVDVLATKVRPA